MHLYLESTRDLHVASTRGEAAPGSSGTESVDSFRKRHRTVWPVHGRQESPNASILIITPPGQGPRILRNLGCSARRTFQPHHLQPRFSPINMKRATPHPPWTINFSTCSVIPRRPALQTAPLNKHAQQHNAMLTSSRTLTLHISGDGRLRTASCSRSPASLVSSCVRPGLHGSEAGRRSEIPPCRVLA